ncbi:ATP-binding cassette domain-containing protein [Thermus sp. PS18]|uniref:ATP-binding cassette domain-containing protein n=1 Tax=Thermus brevis TaxID=2862456 RepID=A0ABS6ZX65_9DEIN|nr:MULTISPECIES: ATP-binding cassette domain-containing protein [Thermus]MBW6394478.1 ATP-binding cassette domain-containing protein [Thermus brevis]UZX14806.1 ATP-binding cassette domain-containing protein [Thermus sp. PS18]
MEDFLRVEGLEVTYEGGFKALDGVDLKVTKGELRVLLGPNGAGKTTLLDAISGRVRPSRGRILFRGKEIGGTPEHVLAWKGVGRKFQNPGVLNGLTVLENLVVATRRRKGLLTSLGPGLSAEEWEVLESTLGLVGLQDKRYVKAAALSHGERQRLELAMVLSTGAELLLLDEPTAGLTRSETEAVADLLNRLRGAKTVVVVEHDMNFVGKLAASVTVLHLGKVLREGTFEEVRQDPEVRAVYLGRAYA